MGNAASSWTICQECQGRGKKSRGLSKKARLRYQMEFDQFEKTNGEGTPPEHPKGHLYSCLNCSGCGLVPSDSQPISDTENYPHVAIIGGGIGGVAQLWLVCIAKFLLHFTNAIATLRYARKAMDSLCNKLVKPSRDWVFSD